ncbi:unnamed protein product [Paramecium octaurelia]|uniref:Uncharacterized protein n=1 Tax=Paramecium octaurelia TaxID=43137 RepID=A0A8S1UVE0_PAROT|nr:unnamed protein product [Paramecium octaurelia]
MEWMLNCRDIDYRGVQNVQQILFQKTFLTQMCFVSTYFIDI